MRFWIPFLLWWWVQTTKHSQEISTLGKVVMGWLDIVSRILEKMEHEPKYNRNESKGLLLLRFSPGPFVTGVWGPGLSKPCPLSQRSHRGRHVHLASWSPATSDRWAKVPSCPLLRTAAVSFREQRPPLLLESPGTTRLNNISSVDGFSFPSTEQGQIK